MTNISKKQKRIPAELSPTAKTRNVMSDECIKSPTLVDVFCGAGGLSLGFVWGGFVPLYAIDKVQDCTETYAYNHPDTIVRTANVMELSEEQVKKEIRERFAVSSVDVVAGGPPCESFSTAGPAIRKLGDTRDTLFEHVIRIGKSLKAKYLLIENIPGLMSKKNGDGTEGTVFTNLLHHLIDYGFIRYDFRVLNAVDYGVPQIRQRLFIVATSDRNLPIEFPEPTHVQVHNSSNGYWPFVTVDNAISDLPSLISSNRDSERASHYAGEAKNNFQRFMRGIQNEEFAIPFNCVKSSRNGDQELTYHWAPNHRPETIERLKMIRQGEGLRDLWMRTEPKKRETLQKRRVLPAKWYIQRFRRLVPSEPSVTVTSHCLDELAHPIDDRLITVREAARLQSFPDSYQFVGGKWINPHGFEPQDKYEQIGDTVPPLLAYAIARKLKECLLRTPK